MLLTIGHSNHTTEHLVDLLHMHKVVAVVDVRSTPTSRYSPHFNRDQLSGSLSAAGIRYAWMGDALGGRPPDRSFYDEAGHVLYGPLSRTPEFQGGLQQLVRNARRYRIALLCAEADPTQCHRSLLVARTLRDQGLADVTHILGDGVLRADSELPRQAGMLEDAWRSPLSVSRDPALNTSSGG